MSESMFKRTGGSDFPDYAKVMLSGPPKSGKTTFLGTVPNIVIADTEPHANNLQSIAHLNIPFVAIESLQDLHKLRFILADPSMRAKAAEQLGMPKIEAVAIDTLDTLQQIMKIERMRSERKTEFQRDDWGWLKEEMTSLLRAFTSLPMNVFFIVHTKTSELGKGDDARTIVLPGLQGSIAEDIAGMVGYSLLAFRKGEIRPDGSPFTKYWLRAEGDETYAFLGNRAAGRLPDVIEPNFGVLQAAINAGRAAIPTPVPIVVSEVDEVEVPTTPAPEVAQNAGHVAATEAPVQAPVQAAPTDAEEPVNAAALTHVKKVYDACELVFPEDDIRALNLGQARSLVRMWQAIQADYNDGKGVLTPREDMIQFLTASGWNSKGAIPAPVEIVPDIAGSIDAVLAFAGDDLATVQEAYDFEMAKPKQRATLVNALVNKGAKPAAVLAALAVEAAVIPETAPADPTEAEATEAEDVVAEILGGEVIDVQVDGETAPCEECGKPIDDGDIAILSKSRFGRWLCVGDYIAQTKVPRSA